MANKTNEGGSMKIAVFVRAARPASAPLYSAQVRHIINITGGTHV
jgi:hypothetical protein